MKKTLMEKVATEMSHLDCVDAKELGEAIDMIKDLEEAMYYHTAIKAMEEGSESEIYCHQSCREGGMTREHCTSYDTTSRTSHDHTDATMMGKSPHTRTKYMEAKMTHDAEMEMKELEKYAQDLSDDIMEMIKEATAEEKQLLQKKIAILATKINT
jgi:hypothetical protein